jgi:hypothetical protein
MLEKSALYRENAAAKVYKPNGIPPKECSNEKK